MKTKRLEYPNVSLYECRCSQCDFTLPEVMRARLRRIRGERKMVTVHRPYHRQKYPSPFGRKTRFSKSVPVRRSEPRWLRIERTVISQMFILPVFDTGS